MLPFFRHVAAAALMAVPLSLTAQDVGDPASRAASRGAKVPEQLPSYRLLDQFNRLVTDSSISRRASIIIVAGRSGSAAAERWTQRIRAALTPSGPAVIPVADLAGAPRFLRGVIRGMFPKDSSVGVALDWDGIIGRPVRGDRIPLVAAVYGADGRLREWMSLSTKTEDLATLQRLVALAN
jgi:hypothetical protein